MVWVHGSRPVPFAQRFAADEATVFHPALIDGAELRNLPFLIPLPDNGFYHVTRQIFQQYKIVPKETLGLSNLDIAYKLACKGCGALIINAFDFHQWQYMYRSMYFRGSILMSAISAIDIALWDIKGKALGVPVYELLGGKCRDKVRTYPAVFRFTPEEMTAECLKVKEQGFTAARPAEHQLSNRI